MRFAWTKQNKIEREKLHSEMAQTIREFIHHSNPNGENSASKAWQPLNKGEHIHKWK
jgi:hypothetical protein